jgi:purine-nucleoside phosphorylase
MTDDVAPSSLVQQAVEYLLPKLPARPTVGIILGSGLGTFAERSPSLATIPYEEVPGFPICSVEGHAGRLVLTERSGPCTAILQGRVHRYEGHSLEEVTRPVRVLAALGVSTLVVTCAAGALDAMAPGTVMLIEDHLNLMGDNPLLGVAGGSERFVEMAGAYDSTLLALAERVAKEAGVPVRRGVLAAVSGPAYETAAEAAMLARLGAQAVSMSTVPEVIIARSLGLRILGLAVITNRSGVRLSEPKGHAEVMAVAESRAASIGTLLDGILQRLTAAQGM